MIVAGSDSPLLLATQGGYNLTRSLRFRGSVSALLSRTPASTTNQSKWTWSGWVKRGKLSTTSPNDFQYFLFSAGTGSSATSLFFNSANGDLGFYIFNGTSFLTQLNTTSVFRDPSAWYHVVFAFDCANITPADRAIFYVNGVRQSTNTTASTSTGYINQNILHTVGIDARLAAPNGAFDGYMAEINFIDGQALTPSSFGQNNAQTGVWQPKKYAGTYGTNGFYLPFTDNSGVTSTTIGKDFSGNGNNWTPLNISVTAGATYDSMTDVPTLTSPTTANFATFNPLYRFLGTPTLSNANLQLTGSNITCASTMAFPTTGKWYAEFSPISSGYVAIGIANSQPTKTQYISYSTDGLRNTPSGSVSYGATYTTNDIIGVAVDCDSSQVTFYKNNVSQGALAFSLSSLSSSDLIFDFYVSSTAGSGINGNFGQRPFTYTPPTGFVALNTFNLPTPTIGATASTQANKYFDISLYTGNRTSRSITNSGSMQPDFVWLKARNETTSHRLFDAIRGVEQTLSSNSTDAESTLTGSLTAFNSNGFSLGTANATNDLSINYVGWQWNAGGSTVTNTSGSISSQVRANASAGFSIVTYTGTGANATVGHGLGVAPRMIIVKRRNGISNWETYHASLGASNYVVLDGTNAQINSTTVWNNTSPTSSVFSLGTGGNNTNGGTYVAYCFSEVAGYSRFGSYTGNGSTDGPFVFCGFRPRYVMFKCSSAVGDWFVIDTSRNTYNLADLSLKPNTSGSEAVETSSGEPLDILSNGFKLYGNGAYGNANGATYIFMAFAENPFKYSLAR